LDQEIFEKWVRMLEENHALYALGLRIVESNPQLRDMLDRNAQLIVHNSQLGLAGGFQEIAPNLNPDHLGRLLWTVNKSIHHPSTRISAANLIAASLRKASGSVEPPSTSAGTAFQRDGIFLFDDVVTRGQAVEMLEHFKRCEEREREDTVLHHRTQDVLHAPHALRIATDKRVLSLVEQHLKATPTIVDMTAWWSLAESEQPHGAQIFHRDRDDFRACKLFVYLNAVTAEDGPHIFVKGSHRLDFVEQALEAKGMPEEAIAAYFSSDGRPVAESIDDIFGDAVTEIVGPSGTCFLENTYGFHRGKIPRSGSRCIFQVLYAAIPYPQRLKRLASAAAVALPPEATSNPIAQYAARYVAKLF
jgi:hypothetical protein